MHSRIHLTSEELKQYYNKSNRSITLEASTHGIGIPADNFWVYNIDTDASRQFTFSHKDMDATQEDTYGWWFSNEKENLKLLIIND